MADFHDLADQVVDEPTLLEFITALIEDWEDEREKEKHSPSSPYGPGANGWENGSIGDFLGAAAAWAKATCRATGSYSPPDNPWRRFAQIVHAGKLYE